MSLSTNQMSHIALKYVLHTARQDLHLIDFQDPDFRQRIRETAEKIDVPFADAMDFTRQLLEIARSPSGTIIPDKIEIWDYGPDCRVEAFYRKGTGVTRHFGASAAEALGWLVLSEDTQLGLIVQRVDKGSTAPPLPSSAPDYFRPSLNPWLLVPITTGLILVWKWGWELPGVLGGVVAGILLLMALVFSLGRR